jgi:hypothetical protein
MKKSRHHSEHSRQFSSCTSASTWLFNDVVNSGKEIYKDHAKFKSSVRVKKLSEQFHYDNKESMYKTYINCVKPCINEKHVVTTKFSENLKKCKSVSSGRIAHLPLKTSEDRFEGLGSRMLDLCDPRYNKSMVNFVKKSKEKLRCNVFLKTKNERISQFNENFESQKGRFVDKISTLISSKELFQDFLNKFDEFILALKHQRRCGIDELERLKLQNESIEKDINRIIITIKKLFRSIQDGTEYRNFLIKVKERTLELPKFMEVLPNVKILASSVISHRNIAKENSKKLTRGTTKRLAFRGEIPEYDTNVYKGNDVDDLQRYLGYLTNKNLFSNVSEFIGAISNIEDDLISLMGRYDRLVASKEVILRDINTEEDKLKNCRDNSSVVNYVAILRNRNKMLQMKKQDLLARHDINVKNTEIGLKDVRLGILSLGEFIKKDRKEYMYDDSNLAILSKAENLINSLSLAIERLKATPGYEKKVKKVYSKVVYDNLVQKAKNNLLHEQEAKLNVINRVIYKSQNGNDVKIKRKIDKRFRPKSVSIQGANNLSKISEFKQIIEYEDN